jgi:peptide/nickel transport system ATP-binding protein
VLIADEPTTALDVTIQAQILELIVGLRRDLGISIVFITHDMGVVAELCDEMVVMYGGRIVERGTVRDVFNEPKHPYTFALLNAVPRLDRHDEQLLAIPGAPPDPSNLPSGCSFQPRCLVAVERCATDRPPLVEFEGSQSAACWVSAQGHPVSLPQPHVRTAGRVRAATDDVPVLSVRDLRVNVGKAPSRFRSSGPVWAVDGVSLDVRAGETLGLVGESGCGKSTLSRAIVGINTSITGSVHVEGRDVSKRTSADRRFVSSRIQYIFQDPYASLNPRRTIGQSLEEALAVGGATAREARVESTALLERVGLRADHLDRYPVAFSGGQRQRVGIARALAAKPKMLICDEPVSALDVSIQAQIINLLADLRDDLGLGYLFIAHDLSVVRHLSDRVAVMYLGRIVEIGPAAQVYAFPQHPYTAALLSSTPVPDVVDPGEARDRSRVVLSGDMPSPVDPPSGCRFRTRCPVGPLFVEGRERCISDTPELRASKTGAAVACHFPGELASSGERSDVRSR